MRQDPKYTLQGGHEEAQWISLSDLMTGLMMMFMLIAIAFMLKVQAESQKAQSDATTNNISNEPVKNEGVPPAAMASATASAKSSAKASATAANKSAKDGTPQPPLSYNAIKQQIEDAKQIPASAAPVTQDTVQKSTASIEVPHSEAQQLAVSYDATKKELYNDLYRTFGNDLQKWGAEIDKRDLVIRFNDPDVLFNTGDASLRPKFQDILKEFFPRYVQIIISDKYKNAIQEVRIEGHTSSGWNGTTDAQEAYFKNMELSQARTRSTLRFVLALPDGQSNGEWLKSHLTANGLSSSHPIKNADGSENPLRSQRVEFRIRTDADSKLDSIANLKPAQ